MSDTDLVARLAVLEVKVDQWNQQCSSDRAETKAQITSLDSKLDELLTFRAKGVGAFWLASTLLGTSLVGALATVVNWMKG